MESSFHAPQYESNDISEGRNLAMALDLRSILEVLVSHTAHYAAPYESLIDDLEALFVEKRLDYILLSAASENSESIWNLFTDTVVMNFRRSTLNSDRGKKGFRVRLCSSDVRRLLNLSIVFPVSREVIKSLLVVSKVVYSLPVEELSASKFERVDRDVMQGSKISELLEGCETGRAVEVRRIPSGGQGGVFASGSDDYELLLPTSGTVEHILRTDATYWTVHRKSGVRLVEDLLLNTAPLPLKRQSVPSIRGSISASSSVSQGDVMVASSAREIQTGRPHNVRGQYMTKKRKQVESETVDRRAADK